MGTCCLEVSGSLTREDRHRRHVFPFQVPDRATCLRVAFRYRPAEVAGVHNLLTVSLFDPARFRGAAHRWMQSQAIVVGTGSATPGFLPGPIAPGVWRLELDTPEILNDGQVTGACEFEIQVGAQVGPGPGRPPAPGPHERPEAPARVVDRAPGWYRGDLHSHTVHSDGTGTVAEMRRAAAAIGLSFCALTDHNTISQWRHRSPGDGALQIRGIECTTYFGHANILGTSDWVDWRAESAEVGAKPILAQVAAQDALAVVNHPCDRGYPVCTGCRWEFPLSDLARFDAIEVWNGGWSDAGAGNPEALALWTEQLMAGSELTAVAGTDSHRPEDYERPDLPYTWVYADELSESGILGALRRGRAYVSCGPTLAFVAESPNGAQARSPGDRLPSGGFELHVDAAHLALPADLWLVSDGVARRLGALLPPGGALDGAATAERWWRLELRGRDEAGTLLALTNPVYQRARSGDLRSGSLHGDTAEANGRS